MKYFIIAGEASGDLHGSRLIDSMKKYDSSADFCFMGGDKMTDTVGHQPIVHYRNMAFMGFVNVILNINKIIKLRNVAETELLNFRPDKVILIDYPGFNLRFAKFVKKHLPSTQVNYYIAPKLWAWKSYRIRSIKRYVDKMYTIFPFETEYFARYNYKVHYVGNPSVDSVGEFSNQEWNKSIFIEKNGLDTNKPIVALLAGSRKQEIKSCLPIMIKLVDSFPEVQFVIAAAPSVPEKMYNTIVSDKAKIIYDSTYKILSLSSAAIVNSGTATLETALFNVPQIVVYKVFGGRIAMLLKIIFIKTEWVSLVNIIAGKEVVKELLAHNFTLENTAKELREILCNNEYKSSINANYCEIKDRLGAVGAAERCAKMIVNDRSRY